MMPVFLTLSLLFFSVVSSEPVKTFGQHSNGVNTYEFVYSEPCSTGEHESGFAIAPLGRVVLKQVNTDGSVSRPVCSDEN